MNIEVLLQESMPVLAYQDESFQEFILRIQDVYIADAEQKKVLPDFTLPTEELPTICEGKTDYS